MTRGKKTAGHQNVKEMNIRRTRKVKNCGSGMSFIPDPNPTLQGGGELKSNREKKKTQIRPEKTGFTSDKKIHPLTFLGSEEIRSESDKTTRIRLED